MESIVTPLGNQMPRDLLVAIHEAGHVVCAWVYLGARVISASASPDGRREGHVDYVPGPTTPALPARARARVALGGLAAEVAMARRTVNYPSLAAYTDTHVAADLLGWDADEVARCLFSAEACVLALWPQLRRVALALRRAGTLTERDLAPHRLETLEAYDHHLHPSRQG